MLNVGNTATLPKIVQTCQTEKDQTEQMQQMLDLEGHEAALKVLAPDTYESLISTHSEETMDHLNS